MTKKHRFSPVTQCKLDVKNKILFSYQNGNKKITQPNKKQGEKQRGRDKDRRREAD